MEIIIHDNLEGKSFEFLIGYIKRFVHKDPLTKKVFGEHPKEQGVYQLLHDENGYVIHTGKVNPKSTLQGIFIGSELVSDEDAKWEYDIVVLDKSNMLDFDLGSEELKRIELWLDTDHKDLKEALGTVGTPKPLQPVQIQDLFPPFVQNALIAEDKKSMVQHTISESLTKILNTDPEILGSIDIFLKYLSEKKPLLPLRAYILSSKGSDAFVGASMSSLESYDDTGELINILKTIETCLFEIQKYI